MRSMFSIEVWGDGAISSEIVSPEDEVVETESLGNAVLEEDFEIFFAAHLAALAACTSV